MRVQLCAQRCQLQSQYVGCGGRRDAVREATESIWDADVFYMLGREEEWVKGGGQRCCGNIEREARRRRNSSEFNGGPGDRQGTGWEAMTV